MVCVYTNLDHVILFTALGFKIHQSLLSKNNYASHIFITCHLKVHFYERLNDCVCHDYTVPCIQCIICVWKSLKNFQDEDFYKFAIIVDTLLLQDVVVYCLQSGDVDVNTKDNAGYTPLHECCVSGNLEIARLLLSRGANVNCASQDGIRYRKLESNTSNLICLRSFLNI